MVPVLEPTAAAPEDVSVENTKEQLGILNVCRELGSYRRSPASAEPPPRW
jgi:hypothetical protein